MRVLEVLANLQRQVLCASAIYQREGGLIISVVRGGFSAAAAKFDPECARSWLQRFCSSSITAKDPWAD